MFFHAGRLQLSATDLAGHLSCRHLTELERGVAEGRLARPAAFDPALDLLRERGLRHEQAYVEMLRATGHDMVWVQGKGIDAETVGATVEAIRAGRGVIVQGALANGQWGGRPDILKRVERPSGLGAWSYEVLDTKLALETKAGTVLQLCLYSELLAAVQGAMPEHMHVVTPGTPLLPESFRTADYLAYYRLVRRGLLTALGGEAALETYPEPTAHCEVCRWRATCDDRRRWRDRHKRHQRRQRSLAISDFGSSRSCTNRPRGNLRSRDHRPRLMLLLCRRGVPRFPIARAPQDQQQHAAEEQDQRGWFRQVSGHRLSGDPQGEAAIGEVRRGLIAGGQAQEVQREVAAELDASVCLKEREYVTAATLKWLEFTEQRALLVAAREGFILWAKPSGPALNSGAYIRSKGLVVPVPTGSVAGGAFGDSELRTPVELPAGVWLPNEPVIEMTIVSDRFDMTLSLLPLENTHSGVGLDEEVDEDVFDRIESFQNRGLAR
jgi:hypothetical protein